MILNSDITIEALSAKFPGLVIEHYPEDKLFREHLDVSSQGLHIGSVSSHFVGSYRYSSADGNCAKDAYAPELVSVIAKLQENIRMGMIRVIVINSNTMTVKESTVSSLDDYYQHLDCRCFDVVAFDDCDVFVDDEGLYREVKGGFIYDGQPLHGHGVVTGGCDWDGETIACTLTVEEVKERLVWF